MLVDRLLSAAAWPGLAAAYPGPDFQRRATRTLLGYFAAQRRDSGVARLGTRDDGWLLDHVDRAMRRREASVPTATFAAYDCKKLESALMSLFDAATKLQDKIHSECGGGALRPIDLGPAGGFDDPTIEGLPPGDAGGGNLGCQDLIDDLAGIMDEILRLMPELNDCYHDEGTETGERGHG